MKKNIANIITSSRILCSFLMIFFPLFSNQFYIIYLLCGISDMIDGTIARKTNTNNEFGARFDTIADFIFITIVIIKLLPVLHISIWLWIWIAIIAIIKIDNAISVIIHRKQFVEIHTVMNKITGLTLFLLPITMHFVELKYSFIVVCFVATFSAIQERFIVKKGHKIV